VQPSINYGFANVTEPWQLSVNHPAVIENQNELMRIIEYWFQKGVDGFRVDMANSLIKNDPEKVECAKLWNRIRKWVDEKYPEHILISEWSQPKQALSAGFHIDMLIHNTNSCLTTLFRHEHFAHKMGDSMFGESYFRKEALGSYDDFLNEYMPFYDATKDIGYMSFITGSHDIKRWTLGRDDEDVKVAYAFIMTMPGVPINYYGDEIGMKYLHITTKEGGRDRTGSRTPMQWCEGKNCGFSESDTPYLPVDPSETAPTVEMQLNDESSLLNFVKSLITLRRSHSALWADATYQTIESGYPVVYERTSEEERIRVIINPSAEEKEYNDTEMSEILLSYHVKTEGSQMKLGSRSCMIYTVL
jgi:maltose alpha-D-glucosyltransferase/alpha-amylase